MNHHPLFSRSFYDKIVYAPKLIREFYSFGKRVLVQSAGYLISNTSFCKCPIGTQIVAKSSLQYHTQFHEVLKKIYFWLLSERFSQVKNISWARKWCRQEIFQIWIGLWSRFSFFIDQSAHYKTQFNGKFQFRSIVPSVFCFMNSMNRKDTTFTSYHKISGAFHFMRTPHNSTRFYLYTDLMSSFNLLIFVEFFSNWYQNFTFSYRIHFSVFEYMVFTCK